MSGWELVRVKRRWISERMWVQCCRFLPIKRWPFRQILTREATEFEKLRAAGYSRRRTLFEIQMWGDDEN
jgi:hypothetical protein